MRNARLVMVALLLVLGGCGTAGPAGGGEECPETADEDGVVDGIDLDAPDWLPVGFPLPDGLSIRHINRDQLGTMRVLTGFISGGDAEAVLADVEGALVGAGYVIVFNADGFVPVGWEALAAVDESDVVIVDVTEEELPVRNDDGACPWEQGLLVSIRFDAPEVAARYEGASLTLGSARAVVGGDEFRADGECFVLPGESHTFGAFDPITAVGISATVWIQEGALTGYASVDGEDVVYPLEIGGVSGVQPGFRLTGDGFVVEGMFVDATGERGFVEGVVEVTCG